jgi:hypothetical protein
MLYYINSLKLYSIIQYMLSDHSDKVKDLLGNVWVNLDIGSHSISILKDMENLIPLVDSCLDKLKKNSHKYNCLTRLETIYGNIGDGTLDLVHDCYDIKVMTDEILDIL